MFSTAFKAFIASAIVLSSVVAAKDRANTMVITGHSGVSAQMMILSGPGKVAILDKAQNNKAKVNGHPAWVVEYDYNSNTYETKDMHSNAFCAGGATLGDGRIVVTGGNKAVKKNGATAAEGEKPYENFNGGRALRFLSAGGGSWSESKKVQLNKERWYASLEPLETGHVMITGGMRDGGYVPTKNSNEPTYEFYPPKNDGGARYMDLLDRSVPLSLYPLTFLMSSGEMFVQANKEAILWNYKKQSEKKLPSTSVPRVYPASGGSVLLPLIPDQDGNYEETVLVCGGMEGMKKSDWGNEGGVGTSISQRPASKNCEQISPLAKNPKWEQVDSLDEGRSMGQFIILPNGKIWFGNGAKTGTAGYNTNPEDIGEPVGQSYGDNPSYQPMIYDPAASMGSRFSKAAKANVARLYHSSATLLPDGSIMVSGSSPRADVSTKKSWATHYSGQYKRGFKESTLIERYYPEYYDEERPSNKQLPSSFSYGGDGFDIKLPSASDASKAKVVIIRTGFSTHGLNMGQRMIELKSVASGSTLHVSQLPPNPNLFAPGPALAFVVVDQVPSEGKFVMLGSGKIERQTINKETTFSKETSKQVQNSKQAQNEDEDEDEGLIRGLVEDISSSVHNVTSKTSSNLKHGLQKVSEMMEERDEEKAADSKARAAGLKRHRAGNSHQRIERAI